MKNVPLYPYNANSPHKQTHDTRKTRLAKDTQYGTFLSLFYMSRGIFFFLIFIPKLITPLSICAIFDETE